MMKLFNGTEKELEAIKNLNVMVTRTEPSEAQITKYGTFYNRLIETLESVEIVGGVAV
jgi:hypothetical protein